MLELPHLGNAYPPAGTAAMLELPHLGNAYPPPRERRLCWSYRTEVTPTPAGTTASLKRELIARNTPSRTKQLQFQLRQLIPHLRRFFKLQISGMT